MRRRAAWRLDALHPRWVDLKPGWGHGVTWDCPLHPRHRLRAMFQVAADGYPVVWTGGPLHHRLGTSFSTLTLVERLVLPPCFSGWIEAGVLVVEQEELQ